MDTGASCNGHFKAATRDDLMRQVADHFREKHRVTPTQTIMNLVDKLAE